MNKSFIVYVLINYSKHSPPLLKIKQASLSQLHAYANNPSNKSSPYDIRKTQTSVMYVVCMWYTQEKKMYQIRVVKMLLSACALVLQQTSAACQE